jgi:glycosyltransferase involved in cell wall biosynthesis
MRFHVLGLAHTISTPEYSNCAFTGKVVRMCAMLSRAGHEVIHYGHLDSKVEAINAVCMWPDIQKKAYPDWDWRKQGFPPYKPDDFCYREFNERVIKLLKKNKQPGDFLLCPFACAQGPIAETHSDMIVIESGIGYGGGFLATPCKVFESYALLHAYLGLNAVCNAVMNDHWYDIVIPNYYDPADFTFRAKKEDYLLFLGRIDVGKGLHIAEQVAAATGHKLKVAGAGSWTDIFDKPHVEYTGCVGPTERRELLVGARAVLCPSLFVEPFCGVQVEAMLSGTPVISPDWGAFAEYNAHGLTGYRCRNFRDFVHAVEAVSQLDPFAIREYAERFTMNAVWPAYAQYFDDVLAARDGGWYSA